MVQSAKVIDVSKTFLPVDPNAFPENLLGAEGVESFGDRVPVMAYDGYNFMPTSYGYKSYFGTNQDIGLDAIPARVDYVLLFQNTSLKNVLIAFTEIGIFTKPGNTGGAWTQNAVYPTPAIGTHYEWTYCVIDDILYAYRMGAAQYWEIKSNVSASRVDVTAKVPNFLNMTGQIGIFRAGGRLAFWDSEDSIGWSNLDDFLDFTPSIETLAGNAKFSDVVGKIVHIVPHGAGFIIYATKSIVYIAEDASATYQWNPSVILNGSGVTYPRNITSSVPDTVHFAWTNSGLYKITNQKPEVIIPEVTDFLKESNDPIYLKVLEGRYLFIEILDPNYINGYANFSEAVVPSVDYVFPGNTGNLADIPPSYLFGTNVCNVLAGITNGNYADQADTVKAGMPGGALPADKKPGTKMKPKWACYLSNGTPLDASAITWGNTPCTTVDPNGVEKNLSPGNVAKTTDLTQTSVNKRRVLGSDMYVDGNWTIERFIAVQSAIWQMEDDSRNAVISAILNRAGTGSKTLIAQSVDGTTAEIRNECTLGRYAKEFSAPQFGYSACQFWLTRYCMSAIDIKRVKVNKTTGVLTTPAPVAATYSVGYAVNTPGTGTVFGTASGSSVNSMYSALVAAFGGPYPSDQGVVTFSGPFVTFPTVGGSVYFGYSRTAAPPTGDVNNYYIYNGGPLVKQVYTTSNLARSCPVNYTYNAGGDNCVWSGGPVYDNTEVMNAYNQEFAVPQTPPLAIDSAYCAIIGFEYTANDGSTKTVAVTENSCAQPSLTPGGVNQAALPTGAKPGNVENNILATGNGSVCSIPFIPVLVPGSPATNVNWPTQVVTIPQGSYLLQDGSIAPIYPTFHGALAYDLQLKKWGKMKGDYKALMDYSPINNALNGIITLDNFKMMAGILKSDGKIYLFDAYPYASKIVYGKIGYYRLGVTSMEEVRVHFRTPSKGSMWIEGSLNGRGLSVGYTKTVTFTDVISAELFGGPSVKWNNITIEGIFDISYLEYRGFAAGRRTGR